jgi:hypothetical protein
MRKNTIQGVKSPGDLEEFNTEQLFPKNFTENKKHDERQKKAV